MTFAESMARLAVLSDEQMSGPWHWREEGEELEVRDLFHRSLEAENQQATAAMSAGHGEVAYAVSLAQRAAGDLAGLIAGQPGALLDRVPAPGEWTLRQTLRHTIETETGFCLYSVWFVQKDPGLPLSRPEGVEPPELPLAGGPDQIIEKLFTARAATDEAFAKLTDADLEKPGRWAGHTVDVRFRLHRHASHLIEHTNQCEKVLHALDADPSEARQLVRAIWAARGSHERHGDARALAQLDEAITGRVDSLSL